MQGCPELKERETAAKDTNQTHLHEPGLYIFGRLAREGTPSGRLSREDVSSRERLLPRLPVAIAARDEAGWGEGIFGAAAWTGTGR